MPTGGKLGDVLDVCGVIAFAFRLVAWLPTLDQLGGVWNRPEAQRSRPSLEIQTSYQEMKWGHQTQLSSLSWLDQDLSGVFPCQPGDLQARSSGSQGRPGKAIGKVIAEASKKPFRLSIDLTGYFERGVGSFRDIRSRLPLSTRPPPRGR
eukprot:1390910-Amorphochlora_amoeboformis.AAC.2